MLHAQTRVSEEDGLSFPFGLLCLAGEVEGGEEEVTMEKGRRKSNKENEDNGKGY